MSFSESAGPGAGSGHDDGADSRARTKALVPTADVIARRMENGTVLVHLGTNKIFELNATGARIWELIALHANESSITRTLIDEFDVDEPHAAAEVAALVDRLRLEGLIEA